MLGCLNPWKVSVKGALGTGSGDDPGTRCCCPLLPWLWVLGGPLEFRICFPVGEGKGKVNGAGCSPRENLHNKSSLKSYLLNWTLNLKRGRLLCVAVLWQALFGNAWRQERRWSSLKQKAWKLADTRGRGLRLGWKLAESSDQLGIDWWGDKIFFSKYKRKPKCRGSFWAQKWHDCRSLCCYVENKLQGTWTRRSRDTI